MKYHNSEPLFIASTKMADIILKNYTLLSLLPRFDIKLGFGEKSVSKLCAELGINHELLLMVCNINTFEGYMPSSEELSAIDVRDFIDYLTRSHNYYKDERILSIESKLAQIKGDSEQNHHTIIAKFFDEYKREVLKHFEYEDRVVFPYVKSLVSGGGDGEFDIEQYEKNHENIDDKLSDLKSIIIKYLPDSYPSAARIDILNDIFLFEDDLDKHTRIEERILIPMVKNIEAGYGNK